MSQAHPAERVPRAAARAARRRARGDRLAVAHLRAARLRQHRDPRRRAARPAGQGRRDRQGDLRPAPAAGRPTAAGDSGLGLHFDLTVPFARYVLENAGQLEFPFRRFQIQPAWRGERPQEGRYRQFTQADIDIVGRDELPFHHDVEVVRVMVEALDALPLPPLSLPGQQPQADPGLLPRPRHPRRHRRDPADRQARQAARRGGGRAARRATPAPPRSRPQRCLELATIRVADTSFVERVRALGVERRAARRRASPSSPRSSRAAPSRVGDRVTVEANLRIARGLDYYTGTVLEIFMAGYERLKSVGGGGRYDALAERRPHDVPRRRDLLRRLPHPGPAARRRGARRQPRGASAVLVALADEERRAASDAVADALRAPRHRLRGRRERRRSSASRSGTPSAGASRTSGSPADGRPRGQGHPLRRAGRRRPGHLDPARRGPATAGRTIDQHRGDTQ